MSPSPNTILVDVGNVLLTVDFAPSLRTLIPPEATNANRRIMTLLEKKDEFEAGQIGEDDYIAWASERLGFTGSADAFREAWCSIFEPLPAMWKSLADARERGLRLIVFSNTNSIHAPWFLDAFPFIKTFDAAIFSHLVGAIKPDPAIYRHAIETYGLVPEQTLYVDDLPENIAGGVAHGFRCHQYDYRQHHLFERWLATEFPVA